MSQCSNDQRVTDLFMCGSHHCGISVLYLTQNLFPPGKLSWWFFEIHATLGISTLAKQNVPWTYRLPQGIVSQCYEQIVWAFSDRLPPADTQKHALENEHLARRDTDGIHETYLNRVPGGKRSFVKMSKCIKGSLPYLQVLVKSKPKLRKILIDNVPESVITAICECCWNLLKRVIPLTSPWLRCLAPHKTHLRALANKKVSRKKKKQYLNQKGGNLLMALPSVLGVLSSLLTWSEWYWFQKIR